MSWFTTTLRRAGFTVAATLIAAGLGAGSSGVARADDSAPPPVVLGAPTFPPGAIPPYVAAGISAEEAAWIASPQKDLACRIGARYEQLAKGRDPRSVSLAIFYLDECIRGGRGTDAELDVAHRAYKLRDLRVELPPWQPGAATPALRFGGLQPNSRSRAVAGYALFGVAGALTAASIPFFVWMGKSHCEYCGFSIIIAGPLAGTALLLIPIGALLLADGRRPIPVSLEAAPTPAALGRPAGAQVSLSFKTTF